MSETMVHERTARRTNEGLRNQSIDQSINQSINQKKPDSQSLERTSAIQVIFKQIEIKTYKLSTSSPFPHCQAIYWQLSLSNQRNDQDGSLAFLQLISQS